MLGFNSIDLTFIQKLEEIIHSNLENENFGVNELARASGISYAIISRRLMSALNKSTSQFIREVRLKRALELLAQGNCTAAEVAYRVGFGTPAYFNTCFHAYYGYTPGEVLRNGAHENFDEEDSRAIKPSGPGTEISMGSAKNSRWKMSSRRRLLFRSVGLLLLVIIAYFILFDLVKSSINFSATIKNSEKSISVLPFENLSSSEENQIFADGITSNIENNLIQIDELRVVANNPFLDLNKEPRDLTSIAKKLNVNYLLTGTIQRDGNRIRVSVELVDASNKKFIWADKYDSEFSEIFQIQSSIAKQVASKLQTVISLKSKTRIEKIPTQNLEAHINYLKGRYFLNKRSWKDIDKSKEYLEKAIAADPNYAEAYSALAEFMLSCRFSGICSNEDRAEKARQYASTALEQDNNLADAHAILGFIFSSYQWEWEKGLKEFQIALNLNPNSSTTYQYYSDLLENLRLFPEARKYADIAILLNPTNPVILNHSARLFITEKKFEDALAECRKIEELDSSYYGVYYTYFNLYFSIGNEYEAVKSIQQAMNIIPADKIHVERIRRAFDEQGMNGVLKYLLKLEDPKKDLISISRWYIRLGEKEKALDCLEKLYEIKSSKLSAINGNSEFDLLRNEPRFQTLLTKMGLDKYKGNVNLPTSKN